MKTKALAILAAALLLSLSCAIAEEGVLYEAEDATLKGNVTVSEDALASGGKVVGQFESDADMVDFIIAVPEDGVYDLTFVCKGIGGGKINRVLVDGQPQGEFSCSGTTFEAGTVRGVLMSAGPHTVTVVKSWGCPAHPGQRL